MLKLDEPFYEMEIKTSGCLIEILINDFPVFSNYENGGMAVDWPLNDAILKSDTYYFKITVLPIETGKNILKQATVDIKIFVKEANKQFLGRKQIYEMQTIDFKNKDLPIYYYQDKFIVEVPYENKGWSKSIDLSREKEESLFQQLTIEIENIKNLLKSKNIKHYKDVYKDRLNEHNTSFYLTQTEIIDNEDSFFYGLPENFRSIDIKNYKLVFYGNNRLVGLKSIGQPAGFVYESDNKDEYGFTEMILFHRKEEGTPLIVIR
ncbi:hypothetical protein [Flavobacterium sp. LM4]|uniref:hypothetical protein n=1 Tax=Flavobacterium sp. LM4 TaxID=1938609 RepID=UPI0009931E03|nr:hypothetical protein [Flavobacterium sp. LM4]OOV20090.1 hypothetical protein BXU10_10840 [Flavobacterium sp. LM4]